MVTVCDEDVSVKLVEHCQVAPHTVGSLLKEYKAFVEDLEADSRFHQSPRKNRMIRKGIAFGKVLQVEDATRNKGHRY